MKTLNTLALLLIAYFTLTSCRADPAPGDAWVYEGGWGTYTNVVDLVKDGYVIFHNPTAPEHVERMLVEKFKVYCTRRAGENNIVTGSDDKKYEVVMIDGCQYLKQVGTLLLLTHKGNCTNKVHGSSISSGWSNVINLEASGK